MPGFWTALFFCAMIYLAVGVFSALFCAVAFVMFTLVDTVLRFFGY